MAKTRTERISGSVETMRPYLERALTDEDFRKDLRDALEAARGVWGDLQKGNGNLSKSATKLAVDKDVQEQLRRALADIGSAGDRLKGKKKSHKGRNTLLVAGVVAGALYNPWTGEQTRKWLTDKVAGGDDLQPLDYEPVSVTTEPSPAETATDAAESAKPKPTTETES